MDDLSFARRFRLRPGGIECDPDGLRVGGVALLARDTKGALMRRDERDLGRELSKRYGFPVEIERKRRGVDAVAAALAKGELARAQIAALLLRLPDPPPYPWAIRLGETWFDGCDPRTGDMLDAKANMDFLFDSNDSLKVWVKGEKNPANQMQRQSRVVTAAGRAVVWHAQTEKTFRGLETIVNRGSFPNLSVVFDPN